MYKYTVGCECYKSFSNSDITLFSVNPLCLKILSDDHCVKYNRHHPNYKEVSLFKMASQFINVKIEKIDGRLKENKTLKYVSVIDLFNALKGDEAFKDELFLHLKGEIK
jgi:hypothetical protein